METGQRSASPAAIDAADAPPGRSAGHQLNRRALTLWPRLDRRRLSRARGDARKVARLVAKRTTRSEEAILSMLLRP